MVKYILTQLVELLHVILIGLIITAIQSLIQLIEFGEITSGAYTTLINTAFAFSLYRNLTTLKMTVKKDKNEQTKVE